MLHIKKCECGWTVLARSTQAVNEGMTDHCNAKGCDWMKAKDA